MTGVSDIRYVGYGTPDLKAERTFYRDVWGLREVEADDGMVYFATEGHDAPYVVRLRQTEEKRIDVIALAAETRADVDALHDKVRASGCSVIFAPRSLASLGGGYGFRFFSPDGLPYEIACEVQPGPSRTMAKGEGKPLRISHIVMHTPDNKAATRFFIDVLGFRLSDWIGDIMSFLRCSSAHHRIAFIPGPPALNHVAYDMPDVNEMMRGIARLKSLGTDVIWGPGRHTAGDNTFSYFQTPNGFTVEYTSELEVVDDANWKPTVYEPRPEVMDQWGIGTGGPHTMPKPEPDAGLFKPSEV